MQILQVPLSYQEKVRLCRLLLVDVTCPISENFSTINKVILYPYLFLQPDFALCSLKGKWVDA